MINKKINWPDFWVTRDGDAILFEQMEEDHARNVLKLIEKNKEVPNPKLLDRIAYFDKNKSELEDLF